MSDSPFTAGGIAGGGLRPPPSRQPEPQAPPQPAPPQGLAVADAIEGSVIGKFSSAPLCTVCFPGRAELARLAYTARTGHPAPFGGTGHEYTALHCVHSAGGDPWKLGDHVARLAAACLRSDHDRCLDPSCECDCGPHEARLAAAAANEGQLAAAFREIAAAFGAQPQGSTELLELVAELSAKVKALEAAQASPAPACSETTKAGEPCKGTPGEDGLCAAHKGTAGS